MKRLCKKHGLSQGKETRDEALTYINGDIFLSKVHPKLIEKWLMEHNLSEEFVRDIIRHFLLSDEFNEDINNALKEANIDKSTINNGNVEEVIDTLLYMPNEASLQDYVDTRRLPKFVKRLLSEQGREKLYSDFLPLSFGHVVYDESGIPKVYLETLTTFNVDINEVVQAIKKFFNNKVIIYDDNSYNDDDKNYSIIKANLIINEDNTEESFGRQFTHRDIPIKIGLTFNTMDKNINNEGGIDITSSPQTFSWKFEEPVSNMEWSLRDSGIAYM